MTGFGLSDALFYNEWHVDSFERTIGTVNEPIFIFQRDIHEVQGLKVIAAEIPFSYYVFNSTNNTFILTEITPPGAGVPLTVTMNVGNYTSTTLAIELERALEAAGVLDYTVTFDSATLKYTISTTGGEDFSLTFGSSTDLGITNPRLWLGFPAGVSTSTAGVLVAPNAAHVSGPDYLLLCSKRLGLLTNETFKRGALAQSGPILAKIPVNVNPGGIILYTDPDIEKYFDVDATVISDVDFFIAWGTADGGLQLLDFNGLSFSLKVVFLTADNATVKRSAGVQLSGRAKRMMIAE